MKIHVSHILVEREYEAKDILRNLAEGKTFEEMAKKYSKCPSAAQGGDLGMVDSGRFDHDFEEAAVALKVGETSTSAVRTRFGYHLIKRLA